MSQIALNRFETRQAWFFQLERGKFADAKISRVRSQQSELSRHCQNTQLFTSHLNNQRSFDYLPDTKYSAIRIHRYDFRKSDHILRSSTYFCIRDINLQNRSGLQVELEPWNTNQSHKHNVYRTEQRIASERAYNVHWWAKWWGE